MNTQHFILAHLSARKLAAASCLSSPEGYHVLIKEPSRTLEQNAAQWPYLEGFSTQLQWPVNGQLCYLTALEWKDILTAAFRKETSPRLAMGLDGGVVMLGSRTSQFGKREFSEWLEFLKAVAAMRNVTPVYKTPRFKFDEQDSEKVAR
jgi:NinB protein